MSKPKVKQLIAGSEDGISVVPRPAECAGIIVTAKLSIYTFAALRAGLCRF